MLRLPPSENFRSPAALARFALVTVLGLALDLWVKVASFNHLLIAQYTLPDGTPKVESSDYTLIPKVLNLHVTVNPGAVFGIGEGYRWMFVIVSILAIGLLTYLFAASGRQRFYQFLLGLLLAGVLGNMYDRVMFGYVRDMLYAFPGVTYADVFGSLAPSSIRSRELFPWIFNIADSLLCVGVFLMLCYSFFHQPEPQAERGEGAFPVKHEDARPTPASKLAHERDQV
jgi:signal peptidase II